jgi:Tfp pilus assembly protein PilO
MLGRLSQLPQREQIGLSLACAALLLVVADQFVVKPVGRDLDRMDVEIEVAERQLQHNRGILKYQESVEAQYRQVENVIGVSCPAQEAIEAFKSQVDEIALRNGISLKSMQHLAPVTTDFLVTYFVEISDFEGETLSLINFLHEVQTAPGLLRLQRLSITSQDESTTVKGSIVISQVMTLAEEQE